MKQTQGGTPARGRRAGRGQRSKSGARRRRARTAGAGGSAVSGVGMSGLGMLHVRVHQVDPVAVPAVLRERCHARASSSPAS